MHPSSAMSPCITITGGLLVAVLNAAHGDPLGTVWVLNPILQLAAFWDCMPRALAHGQFLSGAVGHHPGFFGMNVGFSGGPDQYVRCLQRSRLLSTDLSVHLMMRLLQGRGPLVWICGGLLLGTYQLVYEAYFWAALSHRSYRGGLLPSA